MSAARDWATSTAGGSFRGISSVGALVVVCAALTMIAWLGYRFLVRRDLLMRAPPSKTGESAGP